MREMNSEAYWNDRFATGDWEKYSGKEQSIYFADIAVKTFPNWFTSELIENEWSIMDYGCALGDGTAYLAQHFPSCTVTGIDISEEAIKQASEKYPFCDFAVGDMTEQIEEADIIFSSNTLEHMKNPKKLLKEMVQKAKKYAVLLVPLEDNMGIEEHFHIFETSFFPMQIGDHFLCCMRVKDCRNTEKGKMYWNGKQLLVIYVNSAYKNPPEGYLADFYQSNVYPLQEERISFMAELAEKEGVIAQVQSTNASLESQLAEKNALLAQKDEMIEVERAAKVALTGQVVEKDSQIAQKNEIIEAERSAKAELANQVAERNSQIAQKDEIIEAERSAKAELVNQVAERDSQISQKDEIIEAERSVKIALTDLVAEKDLLLAQKDEIIELERTAKASFLSQTTEKEIQLAKKDEIIEREQAAKAALLNQVAKKDALLVQKDELIAKADEEKNFALQRKNAEIQKLLEQGHSYANEHKEQMCIAEEKAARSERLFKESKELAEERASRIDELERQVCVHQQRIHELENQVNAEQSQKAELISVSDAREEQIRSLRENMNQMKAAASSLQFWLGVAGKSEPMRVAHFLVQVKHALFGTREERTECWRWLRGDRSFVPKYSYLRQCAVRAEELNTKLCILSPNSTTLQTEQSNTGINGYEYKYLRFQKRRERHFHLDCSKFAVTQLKNLVSIILPVYNGDDMVDESIRSVLAQTYKNFELIIVDDGSTDKTPKIVDAWAKKDKRIRVIHQENAKLPRALNRGFSNAKGEFLTWTSADNRMRKDFLEKLVDYMQRNPHLAMCYANLCAIDAKGNPISNNTWYSRGENTGNVYLPNAVLRLNTYPENTIAAAFMYRRAIPTLIGGYDPQLYTVEDYDYWMRINDFFGLKHTDFEDIIYDYRFHEKSLTSKAKELRINEMRDKLMLLEDYRQDWITRPICWLLEKNVEPQWHEMVVDAGDISLTRSEARGYKWPHMGTRVVQVSFAQNGEPVRGDECITNDAIRVLIRKGDVRKEDEKKFDLRIQLSESLEDVPTGWICATNEKTAFDLIEVYCKSCWFDRMIQVNRAEKTTKRKATIVMCTYKRTDIAKQALAAMAIQNMNKEDYEILVINNDPTSNEMRKVVTDLQQKSKRKNLYRYIDCPYPGLSAARNFSLYEANGDILLHTDDDGIMDRDCLSQIVKAFERHQEAGVIGGQIILKNPERFKDIILDGYEGLWSEHRYNSKEYFTVEHDWDYPYGCNYAIRRSVLRDLGGFREAYGRVGKDFAGGEEIVLSCLVEQFGLKVGIEPRAIVMHDVDPSRYTFEHVRQTIRAGRLTNRLMKMDMYKPFDLGMKEEYHALALAQDKMKTLENEGIGEQDMRYVYCQSEIQAAQEAIKAGEEDMKVMYSFVP